MLCFGGSTIVVLGICVHNILVKWNIINDYLNGFDHPDINGTYDFIQMNIGMKAPDSGRVALVTGGATVVFKELIDETLTVKFFDTLLLNGFSVLLLQCGSYHDQVMDKLPDLKKDHLFVDAFDFKSNLKEKMIKCRGEAGVQPAGVVISHAGELPLRSPFLHIIMALSTLFTLTYIPVNSSSDYPLLSGTGTIADCAELEVAQIIVANPRLMDDHQSGFAQTMARERANIIQGHLG